MTAPVVREAEKDLKALSEALPQTPWREEREERTLQEENEKAEGGFFFLDFGTDGAPRAVSSAYSGRGERKNRRRGKKKSSTVRSVEDAESMFGGRGKKKR